MKRYRRPKVVDGQIKMQRGSEDGEVDMCIFYGDNVPVCDRVLVLRSLCFGYKDFSGIHQKPLIKELDARGYDLETLRFSIEKKKVMK